VEGVAKQGGVQTRKGKQPVGKLLPTEERKGTIETEPKGEGSHRRGVLQGL